MEIKYSLDGSKHKSQIVFKVVKLVLRWRQTDEKFILLKMKQAVTSKASRNFSFFLYEKDTGNPCRILGNKKEILNDKKAVKKFDQM